MEETYSTMTAGEIAKAFESGKAPSGGFYILLEGSAPGTYFRFSAGGFRRSASGRRTSTVELSYFTIGKVHDKGVWNADQTFTII